MHVIQTQQFSKTYNQGTTSEVLALKPLDLTIDKGEIFGLLGPNGAGKTTLVKLLLGIIFPTSGSANVLGHSVGSVAAKSGLGYLPENHRYPLYLTGRQTLEFYGNLSGLSGIALHKRIDYLLELVSLAEWHKTKIRKYSKGMLQRLGLAQALLNQPQLLFLDEPTDGVDPIGRREIRDVLQHIKGEGTTIFLNSHLLSEVELITDRVAILNKGSVVEIGTTKELTETKGVYAFRLSNFHAENFPSLHILGKREEGIFADVEIHVPSPELLNATIDEFRAKNVLLHAVTPKKSSLEELFFTLIDKES